MMVPAMRFLPKLVLAASVIILMSSGRASACPSECSVDIDQDGRVYLSDLGVVLSAYPSTPSSSNWNACADFDGDGDVDINDLGTILALYGASCELEDNPPTGGGAPRSWEGGMPVTPYATYNLTNGNMLTTINLCAFRPVGPPLVFALYHNSAHAIANASGSSGQGFSLGSGWSTTGSARVVATSTTATVFEDDGAENTYGWDATNSVWVAPSGVFDALVATTDSSSVNIWKLTRVNQWVWIFERPSSGAGMLREIRDSAGNVLRFNRDGDHGNRISSIASAAETSGSISSPPGHRLTLNYDSGGSLTSIADVVGRTWEFDYDSNSWLSGIGYPYDSNPNLPGIPATTTTIGYDSSGPAGRIAEFIERDDGTTTDNGDGMKWTFEYDTTATYANPNPARLQFVKDWGMPGSGGYPGSPLFTQEIGQTVLQIAPTSPLTYQRVYTDRRGENWRAFVAKPSSARSRIVKRTDPLGHSVSIVYDTSNNVTAFTNELNQTWVATYGAVGNVATITSPLGSGSGGPQVWTLTWTKVGTNPYENFYRLTQVSDPLSHWVQYGYTDSTDPTAVTSVTEMPDGVSLSPSNSNGVTTLSYYAGTGTSGDPLASKGKPKLVTDANGVLHQFEYDDWGFFEKLTEGLFTPGSSLTASYSVENGPIFNSAAGQPDTINSEYGSGQICVYDANCKGRKVCCSTRLAPKPQRLADSGIDIPTGIPTLDAVHGGDAIVNLDVLGRLRSASGGFGSYASDNGAELNFTQDYDSLGRPTDSEKDFYKAGDTHVTRDVGVSYSPGEVAGPTSILGSDLETVSLSYDALGRPETISRSGMGGTVVYDAAGRVDEIDYDNGVETHYVYDAVNRPLIIQHLDSSSGLIAQYALDWNADNTVAIRTETDSSSNVTVVEFSYDARQRLIEEKRTDSTATVVYDITYSYDQLGNRLSKHDLVAGLYTAYYYDSVSGNRHPTYATNNNRLMKYETYSGSSTSGTLLRTVRYLYYKTGDVSNITVKDVHVNSTLTPGSSSDYDWYYDLALFYGANGQMRNVSRSKWKLIWDDDTPVLVNYTPLEGQEFAYDSPRARWLQRNVDPDPNSFERLSGSVGVGKWTDYLGDEPYLDYEVTPGGGGATTLAEKTRYLGTGAYETISTSATTYLHGDLIESTDATSNGSGALNTGTGLAATSYSAFGEIVSGFSALSTRYGYAGGHGYESGLITHAGVNPNLAPLSLQHVGARWYQPDLGRFVQSDATGLHGGLNAYAYTSNNPIASIDSSGLTTVAVGVSGNYLGPGTNFGLEFGVVGDSAGGWGFYLEVCAGPAIALGPGGGVGLKGTVTNAGGIGMLGGGSAYGGVAGGPLVLEGVRGAGYGGGAVGLGVGTGGGGYGGASATAVCDVSSVTSKPIGGFLYWIGSGIGLLPSGPPGYSPY